MMSALRGIYLFLLLCLVLSCGKKGPPRWVEPVPPPVPSDLSALARADVVVLGWEIPAGSGAEGFVVMRSSGPEGFGEIGETKERIYEDTDVRPGIAYTYRVAAVGTGSVRGESSEPLEVAAPSGLLPPSGLAFKIGLKSLRLSWKYKGEEGRFNIYKRTGEEEYPLVPANRKPVTTFDDLLSPGAVVYYTVRAAKTGASGRVTVEGPPSGELRVGPEDYVPSAPAGLGAAVARGKAVLYWDENPEPWVRGYRVYRAADGEFSVTGESRTPAFTDPEPMEGARRYRVSALGPVSESAPSEAITVSP